MSDASSTPVTRKFRTNPVELLIFAIIAVSFTYSVYDLIYADRGSITTAFTAQPGETVAKVEESRSLASADHPLLNLALNCDKNVDQQTSATKVRISGILCEIKSAEDLTKLVKTSVINNANRYTATVFTDVNAGKFSTDYIPLNTGKNTIHVEFAYAGGKVISQDIVVNKN